MTTTVSKKNRRPYQHYPLCEIVWDDAAGFRDGWKDKIEPLTPQLVLSVGFIIVDTPEYIIYASDTDLNGSHNGRTQIPRGMIQSIKVLRKADGQPKKEREALLTIPDQVA